MHPSRSSAGAWWGRRWPMRSPAAASRRSCSRRSPSWHSPPAARTRGSCTPASTRSPGELETRLILRSARAARRGARRARRARAALRGACCAAGDEDRETVAASREPPRATAWRSRCDDDGTLEVPGEAVTDPVAYTLGARPRRPARSVRTGARVEAIERRDGAGRARPGGRRARDAAGGRELRRPARRRGGAPRRRRQLRDLPAQGRVLRVRPARRAAARADPAARARRSGRRACSSSPPSTARSSPARPRTTTRTRPTGRCGRRRGTRCCRRRARCCPRSKGAEPVASYAGLRPAGRGVNYVIGPSPACPGLINVAAIRSTGLSASLGIAEHVVGLVAAGRAAGARPPPCARQHGPSHRGAMVAAHRPPPGGGGVTRLLLGIDEGTTGVKAALFDERAAARARGAARQGQPPSAAGLGRAGRRGGARPRSSRRSPSCWRTPPGEVVACGLDHQGESVLAWDAETGAPLTPDRRLAGQALAGGARPPGRPRGGDPGAAAGCRSTPTSRPPSSPGCSSTTRRRPRARRRHAAHGHGRLVPLRPPRRGLRHGRRRPPRARSCTRSADARLRPRLCELFGVPPEVLPEVRDTIGELGTLRHEPGRSSCALTRPGRGPAGGARRRGLRRARAA